MDMGSNCALPRATITCNTVSLSGPMGTRWGELSVKKKVLLQPTSRIGCHFLMLGKGTICRSCLITVDMCDDLSEGLFDYTRVYFIYITNSSA